LEEYINDYPRFKHSFKPVEIKEGPIVVTRMAEAAKRSGVGPMAAVAGVLADLAVIEMIQLGARVAVVENGGEASIVTEGPIDIALQAGNSELSRRIGFRIPKGRLGLATSSGLYSHAWSFGDAEAVTIFADDAGTADAVATSVGNIIKGDEPEKVIQEGIDLALEISGVHGAFIIYRGKAGIGGRIPQLIKIEPSTEGRK
jgi:hypothetical protein